MVTQGLTGEEHRNQAVLPFLASKTTLTPFFFVAILSLVASILATFIQALRCSKQSWLLELCIGLQSTWTSPLILVSYLLCLLDHNSSSGNFGLSHQSCIIQCWSYFSLCMLCVMMHRCLWTIIQSLLRCHFPRLIQKMWLSQGGFWHHLLYFYVLDNNQPPCSPFSHSCYILRWSGVFCYSCFRFLYFCFPSNLMLCDHICHVCCTWPWNKLLLCCFLFTAFSAKIFYYGSCFSCLLFPPNYIFQNQWISFLGSLYDILEILILKETLTCL